MRPARPRKGLVDERVVDRRVKAQLCLHVCTGRVRARTPCASSVLEMKHMHAAQTNGVSERQERGLLQLSGRRELNHRGKLVLDNIVKWYTRTRCTPPLLESAVHLMALQNPASSGMHGETGCRPSWHSANLTHLTATFAPPPRTRRRVVTTTTTTHTACV